MKYTPLWLCYTLRHFTKLSNIQFSKIFTKTLNVGVNSYYFLNRCSITEIIFNIDCYSFKLVKIVHVQIKPHKEGQRQRLFCPKSSIGTVHEFSVLLSTLPDEDLSNAWK